MTINLMISSDKFRITNKKIAFIFIIISILLCIHFTWIYYYGNYRAIIKHKVQTSRMLFEQLPKSDYDYRWTWDCINSSCLMQPYEHGGQISLRKCNMMCSKLQLWPMPRKVTQIRKKYLSFYKEQFYVELNAHKHPVEDQLRKACDIFVDNVVMLVQDISENRTNIDKFIVRIKLRDLETTKLSLYLDESYILSVKKVNRNLVALITADNFFGARHGLETLSQLIWFDNVDRTLTAIYAVNISDRPMFPYRGLMVDTARNYFPVSLLAKVIDGMAANKLNIFHWHITDAQSFPFEAPRYLNLAKYGSYSPSMVYNADDITYIVEYAKIRGVRVLIEVDAPSHMLEGWKEIQTNNELIFTDDINVNGQLNPENPTALEILKRIYRDILSLTNDDELFHLGGDEVNVDLWKNWSLSNGFSRMNEYWASNVQKLITVLKGANHGQSVNNVILWSSALMNDNSLSRFINLNTTIVQYWYGTLESELIANGLRIIFSNVEYWYLDCGFGAWQEGQQSSCVSYKTWQKIYRATPWMDVLEVKNVLGGEVCMWTELVGPDSLETRIWPRSAAFAERVWTNPPVTKNIYRHVYTRLDTQRERMSSRNIKSEVLWPRYCTMNPSKC